MDDMKSLKNSKTIDDIEISSKLKKHHINKDNRLVLDSVSGLKDVKKYNIDNDKRVGDSLKSSDVKKEKLFASKNENLPNPPKGDVYTVDIDGYTRLLFVIAIAFIIYYGRSKNKSNN